VVQKRAGIGAILRASTADGAGIANMDSHRNSPRER
jgi:hypothetical protein